MERKVTPRKGRGARPPNSHSHPSNNNNHHPSPRNHRSSGIPQPPTIASDYEDSDAAPGDAQQSQQLPDNIPPPTRTNEELNLSVLRRYNPSIRTLLSLAPYAVVYDFNAETRQWEKSGVEGTLFVCQLEPGPCWGEERYNVFVLNRRGLNNFDLRLTSGENIELTEEFVILKTDDDNDENGLEQPVQNGSTTAATPRIHGLWIYSEPPPNSTAETRRINARVIYESAVKAGESLRQAKERAAAAARPASLPPLQPAQLQPHHQNPTSAVGTGQRISLQDLFGHQRVQDDGWSVHAHGPNPPQSPWGSGPQTPGLVPAQPSGGGDVIKDLFRRAGLA
ncbi:hypothetical protein VTN49DRAFT_4988 [Thermomyces lanuginosus]|uniref:uncharacterized protein n=1 Tax=Thermomyces lanuginosus TaxID=5541 RepID=UPI003743A4C8